MLNAIDISKHRPIITQIVICAARTLAGIATGTTGADAYGAPYGGG